MTTEITGNAAGLQIVDPGFRLSGRLVLRLVFSLPPLLRETLLFGSARRCLFLQKAVRRCLGGAVMVTTQFTEGPLRDNVFEFWSSEKYFMLGSSFEREVQRLLQQIVKPGDVVYDVGSHAGYMSLLFSALAGPSGHVFAFEPSAINFPRLKRHVELNDKRNITALNLAASDSNGFALLKEDGSESCLISVETGPGLNSSEIQTIRLDDFVYRDGHAPPTIMKIDVEGHAGRCLAGMASILQNARPVLICELHHPREANEASRILAGHSYFVSDVDAPGQFPRRIVARAESRSAKKDAGR